MVCDGVRSVSSLTASLQLGTQDHKGRYVEADATNACVKVQNWHFCVYDSVWIPLVTTVDLLDRLDTMVSTTFKVRHHENKPQSFTNP